LNLRSLTRLFLLWLLWALLGNNQVLAQSKNITSGDSANQVLGKKYVGKIIFTEKDVSATRLQPKDILSNYLLTNKSNLFMTVILGRPNSDFLGKLEPVLSADSILKLGNYQFSFYVDGRLIYKTNLWPGAPRATQQMTESTWIKPLINNQMKAPGGASPPGAGL